MPGGIDNPVIGYAAFCAVKLVGYTVFARVVARDYKNATVPPIVVGIARTVIGAVIGTAYGMLWLHFAESVQDAFIYFLLGLVPIRMLEWFAVLIPFYDRNGERWGITTTWAMNGTVISFILDLPAIFGFIVTGGLWVC